MRGFSPGSGRPRGLKASFECIERGPKWPLFHGDAKASVGVRGFLGRWNLRNSQALLGPGSRRSFVWVEERAFRPASKTEMRRALAPWLGVRFEAHPTRSSQNPNRDRNLESHLSKKREQGHPAIPDTAPEGRPKALSLDGPAFPWGADIPVRVSIPSKFKVCREGGPWNPPSESRERAGTDDKPSSLR